MWNLHFLKTRSLDAFESCKVVLKETVRIGIDFDFYTFLF